MPSRGLLSHCEIFAKLHLKLGSSDREMEASILQTTAHAAAGLDTSTTVLYCTVLYCTVLYCTVLYCTAGLDTSTRRTFVISITSIIVIIVLSSPQRNGKHRGSSSR